MKNTIFRIMGWVLMVFFLQCTHSPEGTSNRIKEDISPVFKLRSAKQTGILFKSGEAVPQEDKTGLLSGGAGVCIGDINNDGLSDLLFSGGYSNSRLYLNRGDFQFEDVTGSAGIQDAAPGMAHTEGVNLVDINSDGWLDIYLCKSGIRLDQQNQITDYGRNLLYINNQDGTFSEAGKAFGLDILGLTSQAQFFDYDRDGDLDVYFAQLPEVGAAFSFAYYEKPPAHPILSDRLFENQSGKYVDVSTQSGILFERNLSLSITILDINQDRWPDIYVANDFFGRDFLYVNQQNGTFKEDLKGYFSKTPMSSMGSDVGDINRDGFDDLFVGEMMPHSNERQKTNLVPFSLEIYNRLQRMGYPQYTRNMLYQNMQGNNMQEIGLLADIYATEWSWGALFFDADMDGWQDLVVANGIRRDMTNMDFVKQNIGEDYTEMANPSVRATVDPEKAPSFISPNYAYRNINGLQFEEVTNDWGMEQPVHTRGIAYGDLDNDGDPDMVWNNIDVMPSVYENTSQSDPNFAYIKVKLKGSRNNPFAIGAKIIIEQNGQTQSSYIRSQRGFHSMPDPVLSFGVQDEPISTVKIMWPEGTETTLEEVSPNQLIEVNQLDGALASQEFQETTLFRDLKPLGYKHTEKPYSDFKSERLAIQKHSQLGPALATADVNQDNLMDIYIGGASGQAGKLFIQQADGSYIPSNSQPWQNDALSEDIDAVFSDMNQDGSPDLIVASGGSEIRANTAYYRDRIYLNNGQGQFTKTEQLQSKRLSTACLAANDFDQDGDTDLFAGALVVPQDYTQLPTSTLWIQDRNQLISDSSVFLDPLQWRISDAQWADMDNDGWDDLILCGHWFGPAIFFNQQGRLTPSSSILPDLGGWWNTLQVVDLDGDDDLDIIAGNHGMNSIFQARESQPMTLLINDFDQNGQMDPVLFKYTYGVNSPFANRDLFCSQMPGMNNQYYSFKAFGEATYANMFSEELKRSAIVHRAYEMRSCWFENKGRNQWTKHPLPMEAQSMQVNDLLAHDIDKDGRLDLILVGGSNNNHFEYGPIDGGVLVLKQLENQTFETAEFKSIETGHAVQKVRQLSGNRFVLGVNNGDSYWMDLSPQLQ